MTTQITQLRWPASLRQAVVAAARANRRSMNSEILSRLESTFPPSVDQIHGHLLPCPCGAGRPDAVVQHLARRDLHQVLCSCGRSANGDTEDAAALRWNAMVRGTGRAA